MDIKLNLKKVIDLKGGENSHLRAELLQAVDELGKPLGVDVFSPEKDLGARARVPGWTNIGDMSACLRTSVGLGDVYRESETPHIAVAAKHTRPVVIANGRTQLEAVIKAIAGDLNSPFGGVWGFNTPLTRETAAFFNRPDMFFEGMMAPDYEEGTVDKLKDKHKNRFLVRTGIIPPAGLNVLGYNLQPVVGGHYLKQTLEPRFDARKEAVVVTGNRGDSRIESLSKRLIDDINFAGNAAIYLASNLVFFVHNGAIAGLGDGCGARTVAAEKARRMLEVSAYAALSEDTKEIWERVLFDTPFTRDDFTGIEKPLRLTAFSDAFYPKLDGFVETAGLDRVYPSFSSRGVKYQDKIGVVEQEVTFIPKRNNLNPEYDGNLIPAVVVQPGGSLGDKVINPIAERYRVKMVYTMTPEQYKRYQAGEKGITGRRFFGHIIM
ncbi:hypothetical protein FJZ19_02450 [Candidatus Pacearchaeota archaeon]|nr:hypothetical protein [Candidatus Pacearchaeota archaeon]